LSPLFQTQILSFLIISHVKWASLTPKHAKIQRLSRSV
jgi:hypothetical protein